MKSLQRGYQCRMENYKSIAYGIKHQTWCLKISNLTCKESIAAATNGLFNSAGEKEDGK